jgi:hypothetical protein
MPKPHLIQPYPPVWNQRQVRSNGQIKWDGRKRFVGEAFVGRRLGFKPLKRSVHAVYFNTILIGHLHDNDPGAMRPAVYQRWQCLKKNPKM